MHNLKKLINRNNMKIRKAIAALFAVILLTVGFSIGYLIKSAKTEPKDLYTISKSTQFQNIDKDNLIIIRDTVNALLKEKKPSALDSLKQLGQIRDSLLEVEGKIKINLMLEKDPKVLQRLDSILGTVKDMVSLSDKIIMDGAIEILRSINSDLRILVKDLKEQTEKLENVANNIDRISDVITTLGNILSTPLFGPKSSTAPAT